MLHRFPKSEIVRRFSAIVGKTLGEIDKNRAFDKAIRNPKVTGIAGDVIEKSVLEYPSNSSRDPDLEVDGVPTELKVTGVRKKADGFEAKEPMSITGVSIGEIEKEENFESSMFWKKSEHLLIVFYHYIFKEIVPAIEYMKFPVLGYTFNEFSKEDKDILMNDWTTVRDFIRELSAMPNPKSEYPRLSSELREKLVYIDTAPKYPHPPRFRFKRSFVNVIVKQYFSGKESGLDAIYSSYDSFYGKCHDITCMYGNKSIRQIATELGIPVKETKSLAEYTLVRMFGGKGRKLNNIDFFKKFSIHIKSITLSSTDKRTEDMKLFPPDFEEISDSDIPFEETSFFDYFFNQHFLFPVFKEPYKDCMLSENVFLGFKEMMFPVSFIKEVVEPLFNSLRSLIVNNELKDVPCYKKDGTLIINKKTGTVRTAPNFPKSRNGLLFLRGGGEDSFDKPEVINGVHMYYQTVWIKGTYIVEKLAALPFL